MCMFHTFFIYLLQVIFSLHIKQHYCTKRIVFVSCRPNTYMHQVYPVHLCIKFLLIVCYWFSLQFHAPSHITAAVKLLLQLRCSSANMQKKKHMGNISYSMSHGFLSLMGFVTHFVCESARSHRGISASSHSLLQISWKQEEDGLYKAVTHSRTDQQQSVRSQRRGEMSLRRLRRNEVTMTYRSSPEGEHTSKIHTHECTCEHIHA